MSWKLPADLRGRERDLPALAWLAARRCGRGRRGGQVDRLRAAALFPVLLVLLVVQHGTGTLAVRGRGAFVFVTPLWTPAQTTYRAWRVGLLLAWLLGGLLAVTVLTDVLLQLTFRAMLAVGATEHAGDVAVVVPAATLLGWSVGLLAHPLSRDLARLVRRRLTLVVQQRRVGGAEPAQAGGRAALLSCLCGGGRPSAGAARLGLDVIRHAHARGWELVTNPSLDAELVWECGRAGFAVPPDGSRRLRRPARDRAAPVAMAIADAAWMTGETGVVVDEVRVTDGSSAVSWGRPGKAVIALPVQYMLSGVLEPAGRAALAHEFGHHHFQHFQAGRRRGQVVRRLPGVLLALIAVNEAAAVLGRSGALPAALVLVAGAAAAVIWVQVCSAPERRAEYDADAFAARLVGADLVDEQLGRHQARVQAESVLARGFARAFDFDHPSTAARRRRVQQLASRSGTRSGRGGPSGSGSPGCEAES